MGIGGGDRAVTRGRETLCSHYIPLTLIHEVKAQDMAGGMAVNQKCQFFFSIISLIPVSIYSLEYTFLCGISTIVCAPKTIQKQLKILKQPLMYPSLAV